MPYAAAAAVRRSPFGRFILWTLYVPRFLDSQVSLWQRSCRGLAPPSGVVVGPALPYSAFPAASPCVDGSTASSGFWAVASSGILPAAIWTTNAHDAVGKAERGGLWLWKEPTAALQVKRLTGGGGPGLGGGVPYPTRAVLHEHLLLDAMLWRYRGSGSARIYGVTAEFYFVARARRHLQRRHQRRFEDTLDPNHLFTLWLTCSSCVWWFALMVSVMLIPHVLTVLFMCLRICFLSWF
jgi:hypothetical protein